MAVRAVICKKAHDWSGFVEVKTMIAANITSGKYNTTRILEMLIFVSRENKKHQLLFNWGHLLAHQGRLSVGAVYAHAFTLAATGDFQQCGMCDQQSLRSACAYA